MSVHVVIPAFNENSRIGAMLACLPATVAGAVVVDDASTDGTADVVAEHQTRDPRIRLVRLLQNQGVGRAIAVGYRTLLHEPTANVFVVMAGDGQMNPADLPALLAPLERGEADYVKGERFTDPRVRARMPKERYVAGQILSRLTAIATGQRITDSQCGYTAITRQACAQLDLDALWPRYGYPNDLLGQLAVRGLRVAEVPVEPVYLATLDSKLRPRHVPGVLFVIGRSFIRRAFSTKTPS
jgi:glycosyltransferase involved in cell wall biosynthesis